MPTTQEFRSTLKALFAAAAARGATHIDVEAGDLHREVGGYPGCNHRMPSCCSVMAQEMRTGDSILSSPSGGKGASLIIRYFLPRAG